MRDRNQSSVFYYLSFSDEAVFTQSELALLKRLDVTLKRYHEEDKNGGEEGLVDVEVGDAAESLCSHEGGWGWGWGGE
ncbi:hypothetical protein VNO78_33049 [Psophocarpus tetragonolobus]|uniref:Uncharacterized protein n=1 Tax=Psophocarpus tetragonolobus TaxID=3891 RepID=A0AAN9NWM7_PSOTE